MAAYRAAKVDAAVAVHRYSLHQRLGKRMLVGMGWVQWSVAGVIAAVVILGFGIHFWDLRKEAPKAEREDTWITAAFLLGLILFAMIFKIMR